MQALGVQVRLGKPVTQCGKNGVEVDGARIEGRTLVWAAGVMASPAAQWLGVDHDRAGRVKVDADLTLSGHPEIFVIGDTASVTGPRGRPLPGVAPVAKQQGAYVARSIRNRLRDGGKPPPFSYRDFGSMATIGRKSAVVEFGRFRVKGFAGWLIWSIAHIYFLIGFRNRLIVVLNWAWNYLTFQRGARLITGLTGSRMSVTETLEAQVRATSTRQ